MSKFSNEKTYALFNSPANKKLAAEISAAGAKTIFFPTVEITENRDSKIAEKLNYLTDFDWLVFPNVYAVEFFLRQLEEINFDFFELDAVRICAYGESVADRLRFAQVHADVISNSVKTADVWEALKNYLFDDNEFSQLRFLIFKEKNSRIELAENLTAQNAAVEELAIYQTVSAETAELAKFKTLLRGGAIDEFIFTSPFDIINLAQLFPDDNLADVLDGVKLSPIDKQARQSLAEFRLIS